MKQNEITAQLLAGNKPDSLYGDIGIRSGEYDGITHNRLMEFMKVYPCKSVSIGKNNYGTFQFISLEVKQKTVTGHFYNDCLQFWGNGYHERKELMIVNYQLNVGNYFLIKDKPTINKTLAMAQVRDYRHAMGIGVNAKQTSGVNRFSYIADLTDDDFAQTYLQDYE